MASMKKTLLAIIVTAIIIGSVYLAYVTYVSGDYERGAPEPEIIIRLTESATGESHSVTLEPTRNVNAATIVTSTLYAVNPDAIYNIEFLVNYEVTPPAGIPTGTTLVGYVTMSGYKVMGPSDTYNFAHGAIGAPGDYHPLLSTPSTPLTGYAGTAKFDKPDNMFNCFKDTFYPNANPEPIKGAMLGGSVWTLVCHAQTTYAGTGAYEGSTTVTINMTLGAGNLVVSATGVQVTVTAP